MENVREIPSAMQSQKAMNQILLADLYLELGDREAAVNLVASSGSGSHDRDIMARLGLGAFTTAPLAISIYVRTRRVDEALEIAQECGDSEPIPWVSLGVFCAGGGSPANREGVGNNPK